MGEIAGKAVLLNREIGFHLLNFLDGTNASNFLEVMNDTNQFQSIAATSDHTFRKLINEISYSHQNILLPREVFEDYLDECEVIDDKLVLVEKRDSTFIQPCQRLYVHPCFGMEGFGKLCKAYRTSIFQCYSRLLSFNTDLYCADFGLIDYELYSRTISSDRDLNDHERKLFKLNTYFNTPDSRHRRINLKFVNTVDEFRQNLATRFDSCYWLEAIDFTKFTIVGGCVINALCYSAFPDTKEQDINLIYPSNCRTDFEMDLDNAIARLQAMAVKYWNIGIRIEKVSGLLHYNVFLPCGIRLNFIRILTQDSKDPISHILYNFDMDICQAAFLGNRIICTFAFLQALATKSFVTYSLHAGASKNVCNRIAKFCARGFYLLEPNSFDGDFDVLMKQNEIPLYRSEHLEYIDDEGEVQINSVEYWRRPARNLDTFQLQEAFMALVYLKTLE